MTDQAQLISESFRVAILGPGFQPHKASLPSALEVLQGYHQGFQIALDIAAKIHPQTVKTGNRPTIAIHSTEANSLDINTIVEVAIASAPLVTLAPEARSVIETGWDIYQKATRLISYATDFFQREGYPLSIQVNNSPGTIVNVLNISGNNVNVSQGVLDTARSIHKPMDKMAQQVVSGYAESISVTGPQESKPISINEANKYHFKVPFSDIRDQQPIEIKCGLYSLNKNTLSGRLELLDEQDKRRLPFSIEEGQDIRLYADGLKATFSIITAIREMHHTALGEKLIKRLHIYGIKNYYSQAQ